MPVVTYILLPKTNKNVIAVSRLEAFREKFSICILHDPIS